MRRIYDITNTISPELPVFPGDPPASITPRFQMTEGDPYNVSLLAMGSHTGTHIDAPYHFEPEGNTVDNIPLDACLGPCRVVEVPKAMAITPEHVASVDLGRNGRVLFKTRNSGLWAKKFRKDFAYITPEAARHLVSQGVRLVGIDYLSVEQFGSKDFATHHALLRSQVVILEGINLSQVKAGDYELIVLPLKICDGDGSPSRALLLQP